MVFTPGTPSRDTVSGYDIWSSTSLGERPIHSVKTICWFSPISGIASTGTGLRISQPVSQSNGATIAPQTITNRTSNPMTSLFVRQKCMSFPIKDLCSAVCSKDCLSSILFIFLFPDFFSTDHFFNPSATQHHLAKVWIGSLVIILQPLGSFVIECHWTMQDI